MVLGLRKRTDVYLLFSFLYKFKIAAYIFGRKNKREKQRGE